MTKICTLCKTEKPISDFHVMKAGIFGKASRCKVCKNAKNKQWVTENKERMKVARRNWNEQNRERHLDSQRRWAKKNKLRVSYRGLLHRDRKRGRGTLSFDEYVKFAVLPCSYCGDPSTGWDRIDNSRGHELGNVVPACGECNITRGDRWTYKEMVTYIAPALRAIRESRKSMKECLR